MERREPAGEIPKPSSFATVKQESLQRRLYQLQREYASVSRALEVESNPGTRERLTRQLEHLEEEISALETQETAPAPSTVEASSATPELVRGTADEAPASSEASPQAGEPVKQRESAMTLGQRRRLQSELSRLQGQYDTWTRRITALDTDIGRALDALQKQVLEERRADLLAERDLVAQQIEDIETQLGS